MVSAGKIKMAIDAGTGELILSRLSGLSPKEEAVASAAAELAESVNTIRGPLGAAGFRGAEAFAKLQAQAGQLMGDPMITRNVLGNLRETLTKLNSADRMIMSGHGLDAVGPTPPPNASDTTKPSPPPTMKKAFNWDEHPVIK
jgi:hypothetical protein